MADDEYETDVQVRFRDIDSMGHVNNAVYATYLEQGRAAYYSDIIGEPLQAVDTVIATLELDYQKPIEYGDDVTVALWIDECGESSIPMAYEIRTNGDVAATAETVQVVYDREAARSKPVPDQWRRRIEDYHRTGD